MLRYLMVRLMTGLMVIWLVTIVTFLLFFAAPNNVAHSMAGKMATPEMIERIEHQLGLDQPLWKQYLDFLGRLLQGDLGYDYYYKLPVSEIILDAAPISISIALGAAIIWLILGVSSGVISAVFPRSIADRFLNTVALFFYSMPSFLLGMLFLYLLYYQLTIHGHEWFAPGGYAELFGSGTESVPEHGLAAWAHHLVLPWFTLALLTAAAYTRFTRGSMLEVLGEDYIRTARAKGLSERRVVVRHAMRSAMTPVTTQFGIDLAALAGGTLVTEQVYGMHGLGWTAVKAITNQDLPVILGIVLVISIFVVLMNFVVDIMYAVLDPRVRLY